MALILLNYIGNFSHYAALGVYEDDYLFTLPVFSWPHTDWWQRVASFITTWPQGRAVWWIANDTLTFAVSRLDSLPFLYVIAFLSSSCCLFVLYSFLRRFLSEPTSFIATVLYCLYPVANAKVIFMHQICFFWVPIFVLFLFTQYFKGRHVWFFMGSLIVLLAYEPYFLVLPFAPLLSESESWSKTTLKASILFPLDALR
jgi:hypothetical protein